MKKQLLSFVVLIMFVSALVSGEKKKKTLYKRFTEYFDKKVEKAEKELPPKIEKGMETFTDKLEDFENDIHAEPKKQSKFAKIFNYIADIDITETYANDYAQINPEDIERVGAYTDAREEK